MATAQDGDSLVSPFAARMDQVADRRKGLVVVLEKQSTERAFLPTVAVGGSKFCTNNGDTCYARAAPRPLVLSPLPIRQKATSTRNLASSKSHRSAPSLNRQLRCGSLQSELVPEGEEEALLLEDPSAQRSAVSESSFRTEAHLPLFHRAESVVGRIHSVSDGLCEWPSVSTTIDDHLQANGVSRTNSCMPSLSTTPGESLSTTPNARGVLDAIGSVDGPPTLLCLPPRLHHSMEYAAPDPTADSACHYYFRRASLSGDPDLCDLAALGPAAKQSYGKSATAQSCGDTKPQEQTLMNNGSKQLPSAPSGGFESAPPRLLRSLAVTEGMYSLGTATRAHVEEIAPKLRHSESVSSDLGYEVQAASPRTPLLAGRSIFHTKRLLEAVMLEEQVAREAEAGGVSTHPLQSVANRGACYNPGGIGPLMAALEHANHSTEEVAMAHLEALSYMAYSATNCSIITAIGGLPVLARLLTNWGSTHVGLKVAMVLQNMAAAAATLRGDILLSGALPGLLWLLRVGTTGQRLHAVKVLALTCDRETNQTTLRSSGAVSASLQALAASDTDEVNAALLHAVITFLCKLTGRLPHLRAAVQQTRDKHGIMCKLFRKLELQWVEPQRATGMVSLSSAQETDFLTDLSAEVEVLGFVPRVGTEDSLTDLDEEGCSLDTSDVSLVQQLAATSIPRWRTYGDSHLRGFRSSNKLLHALQCPALLEKLPEEANGGAVVNQVAGTDSEPQKSMRSVASCPLVATC